MPSLLRLISSVLEQEGRLTPSDAEEDCGRICVAAAKALLRASTSQICLPQICTKQFLVLASIMKDPMICTLLYPKLVKLLAQGLHPKFMILFTMCTMGDSSKDILQMANSHLDRVIRMWHGKIQSMHGTVVAEMTTHHPECQVQYLIHMLANLGADQHSSALQLQKPLHMFLTSLINSRKDSASYLKAVVQAVSKIDDRQNPGNPKLHLVSELAGRILSSISDFSEKPYPGKIKFSQELFQKKELTHLHRQSPAVGTLLANPARDKNKKKRKGSQVALKCAGKERKTKQEVLRTKQNV